MYKAILLSAFLILFASATASAQAYRGKVFWKGVVDDKVQLSIHGDELRTNVISGSNKGDGVFSFTAALPNEAVTVTASAKEGRGSVKVVQQPSSSNGFTAIVEIYDDNGGSDDYLLEISWR